MTQVEPLGTAITTVFSNIANNVVSQLAAACAATDTNVTLLAGTGAAFPPAPFYCSIEYEVLWCSSKVGDVFSVQRGVDGTTAASHVINSIIQIRNNAGLFHDAYTAIQQVDAGVTSGTALPPNVAYTDKTQEFLNKTINLSKGNVIIGTVQPDPSSLPLVNILNNGGFEEWYVNTTNTIAAGGPTSGFKNSHLCNGWDVYCMNDSSITGQKDSANPDPSNQSGTDLLMNVTTVQVNDWAGIFQSVDTEKVWPYYNNIIDFSDMNKMVGQPISLSARVKLISGNISLRLQLSYNDGTNHDLISSPFTLTGTSGYQTYKFENQIPVANQSTYLFTTYIAFQGVGQVSLDGVMLNLGAAAVGYRPKSAAKPVQVTNLLTNGGFEIWQRGNGPFNSPNAYCADRWRLNISGSDTLSVQADGSNVDSSSGSLRAASVNFTNANGGNTVIYQELVLNDFNQVGNRLLTLSVRVQCDTPNTIRCSVKSDIQGPTYSSFNRTMSTGVWQTLVSQVIIAAGAAKAEVGIYFSNASCAAHIDNAMLVVGPIPADYSPMHPADDLARCQRYYEIIGEQPASMQLGGYVPAGGAFTNYFFYKSRKMVIPTVTKNGTWALSNATAQPTVNQIGTDGFTFGTPAASALGMLAVGNNTSGNNITIEANPS